MAKPWNAVAGSDAFKALPPEEQEKARSQYFDTVVAPHVPKDKLATVRGDFDQSTKASLSPTPETISLPFGTETMYRMAHDPGQKSKVLESEYGPGSVQADSKTGELYAAKDGKRYAPGKGGFLQILGTEAVAGAAPFAGQVIGETLGGVAGAALAAPAGGVAGTAAAGPPGGVAGALGGAGVGGAAGFILGGGVGTAAGETVNNLILRYMANAPSSHLGGEALEGFESGALWSGVGAAMFKGAPAIYNAVKENVFARSATASEAFSKLRNFDAELKKAAEAAGGKITPERAIQLSRDFFGVDPVALGRVAGAVGRAEEQGTKLFTNPATYAKGSPALGQLEALASKMGVSKVLQSTREYAEATGRSVKAKLGEATEVGKSVFGGTVDYERLGASLREGARQQFDRSLSQVRDITEKMRLAQEATYASKTGALQGEEKAVKEAWTIAKGTLETQVKELEEKRSAFIKDRLSYLGHISDGLLELAGPVSSFADRAAQADFGKLSKHLAEEAMSVKAQVGASHGAVLEAAYSEAPKRLLSPELVDSLKQMVANALPSEKPALQEVLEHSLPPNLRKVIRAGEGEAGTAQVWTDQGAVAVPVPSAPVMVSLKEMNELKKVLGMQARTLFDKVAPNMREGLQKRLFGAVKDFIHDAGEDVPAGWKSAASKIETANLKYSVMMDEIDSKLVNPLLVEAKAGLVQKDLDAVARDIFSGNHPRDTLDRLFTKYVPANREKLIGADMFNVFRDAVDATGVKAGTLPPVDIHKVAAAFAARDEKGLLKYYGDPKLVSAIRGLVSDVAAFEGKSLPTSLVPSRTMQETVEALSRTTKALEQHIKADPGAVFQQRFADLEKASVAERQAANKLGEKVEKGLEQQWKESSLDRFRRMHDDGQLSAAAERMLSHPSYIRDVVSQFGARSQQVQFLRETFTRRLLSHAIEEDKGLVGLPDYLKSLNIHLDVARLLSPEGSAERIATLGQDVSTALERASDTYSSLMAGSAVQHPPIKIVRRLTDAVFGGVPGLRTVAGLMAKTIDRSLLSKVVGASSTAIEHPNFVKLMEMGDRMTSAERNALYSEWLQDITVEVPFAGYYAAKGVQKVFGWMSDLAPGKVVLSGDKRSISAPAPLWKAISMQLSRWEPEAAGESQRQDTREDRSARSVLQSMGGAYGQ